MPEICEEKSKIHSSYRKRVDSLSSDVKKKYEATKSFLEKSGFSSKELKSFDDAHNTAADRFYMTSKKMFGKYFVLNSPDAVHVKKVCSDIFTACKVIAEDFIKTCDNQLELVQKNSCPVQPAATTTVSRSGESANFFPVAKNATVKKLTDARVGNNSFVENNGAIPKPTTLWAERVKQNQLRQNAESISKDRSYSHTPRPGIEQL